MDDGATFGCPAPYFTIGEMMQALAIVTPRDQLEAYKQAFAPDLDAPCQMWVPDPTLLVLAALSVEYARRIQEHRPELRDRVAVVRTAPLRYLRSVSPPGQDPDPAVSLE